MRHKGAERELDPQELGSPGVRHDAGSRPGADDQRSHAAMLPYDDHVPMAFRRTDRSAIARGIATGSRFDIWRVGQAFFKHNGHAAASRASLPLTGATGAGHSATIA